MNETDNLLKLSYSKLTSKKITRLITTFNIDEIFEKDLSEINNAINIKEEEWENVKNIKVEKAKKILSDVGAKIININDEDYPENLKNVIDPPPIIYLRGELKPEDSLAVGIVGSRNCTEYGRTVAKTLAKELAPYGITIISGLARGIDTAAHFGALEGGGRTIAVMATGIERVYPSSNRNLASHIVKNGALVTDFPPLTSPIGYHFPLRNRIISGLSNAIIAVQAEKRSGVFSTVSWALDYNREVFAVPGNVDIRQSRGTNKLIKMGASVVTSSEDILQALNISSKKKKNKEKEEEVPLSLPGDEKIIYEMLGTEPIPVDAIIEMTGFTIQHITSVLLLLELKGLIREVGGKRYIRNFV